MRDLWQMNNKGHGKVLIVKPTIFCELNFRCQTDPSGMQAHAAGWIIGLHICCSLPRPLNHICFVASFTVYKIQNSILHSVNIFTMLAAASVLQSNNGCVSANTVTKEVCCMWDETKIVRGKSSTFNVWGQQNAPVKLQEAC